jgi:hypothetical protein
MRFLLPLVLSFGCFAQTIVPSVSPSPSSPGGPAVLTLAFADAVPSSAIAGIQWTLTLPTGVTAGSPTIGSAAPAGSKAVACGPAICLVYGINTITLVSGVLATIPLAIAFDAVPGQVQITVVAATTVGSNVPVTPGNVQLAFGPPVMVIACGSPTDQYFSGGIGWTMPLPAPSSFLRYATSFAYNIPVPNGIYLINITMVEPNKTGAGQRVFTVAANGQTSAPIDLYAITGAINIPYVFPMEALVGAGFLRLQFQATAGNAVVSAISITPIWWSATAGAQSYQLSALAPNQLAMVLADGTAIPVMLVNQGGTAPSAPVTLSAPMVSNALGPVLSGYAWSYYISSDGQHVVWQMLGSPTIH